jgi:hypothetical protein
MTGVRHQIQKVVREAPGPVILATEVFPGLHDELGSQAAAVVFLERLAGKRDLPIGIQVLDSDEVIVVPPTTWDGPRVDAWIAAAHADLSAPDHPPITLLPVTRPTG